MGIYRFLLAACVVIEHLSANQYLSHTGMFAVFGFYVLSGYLITRVLNDVYKFELGYFWSNRFLRLAPPYLCFLASGLAIIFGTTTAAEFFPEVWKAQPDWVDWTGVLLVFPMGVSPMDWHFRPVPSIWSVGVELLNYGLLYLFVGRGKRVALCAALVAACYHAVGLWRGDPLSFRYFPFYAALLPFALGALIYFYTRSARRLSRRVVLLLCAPAGLVCLVAGLFGGAQNSASFEELFYLNLAAQCLAVYALSLAQGSPSRVDKRLGDLSYPIFLCHWQVGYVVAVIFFPGEWRGLGLMAATLIASPAVAYVVCWFQDLLIEPIRSVLRSNARLTNPAKALHTA
jgi:peptidoglycan/LPS O-acetylase OafA/YrhL